MNMMPQRMTSSLCLTALLVLVVSGGCKSAQPAPGGDSASGQSDAAVVRLERGACYGRCAEYTVALFEDGAVYYEGRRAVQAVGVHRRRVDASAIRALLDEHAATHFATPDTLYVEGQPGCGKHRPDGPTLQLTVRQGSRTKTIRFDSGCEAAPRTIPTFATAVDRVAGTEVWTTLSGGTTR